MGLQAHAKSKEWPWVLLLAGAVLAGCSKGQNGQQPPGAGQPVPVTIALAVETNVPLTLQAIGHVTAYSSVAIQSQVDGQLASVHFQQGDVVAEGDLVAEIDPKPYQAAVNQAQANETKDAANQKLAALEEHRNYVLVTNGIVSSDVYDQARASNQALQATVAADQAAVETAKLQLSYCYIRSPVNGRTGNLLVTPGNIIKKQDSTILYINQTEPIYVDFTLPEKNLPEVRRYFSQHKLPVSAAPSGEQPSMGELLLISNMVDTNTGTVALRARFANTNETLWPGQFVDVQIRLTVQSDIVTVPSQAVQMGQTGNSIFVVNSNNTAEYRTVTTGRRVDNQTVIEKGVSANERVVTSGQLRLTPGAKVLITQ